MPVFFQERDYNLYKSILAETCEAEGVDIWAYCLMPNHVHLIAVPRSIDALARTFREAHRRYTSYINKREGWSGHLWQDRFASFVMDEPYTLMAARYIERNPVAANLIDRAEAYPWSSAAAHLSGCDDGLVNVGPLLAMVPDWLGFINAGEKPQAETMLQKHLQSGLPLGSENFIAEVELKTGQTLQRRPRGRPVNRDGVE